MKEHKKIIKSLGKLLNRKLSNLDKLGIITDKHFQDSIKKLPTEQQLKALKLQMQIVDDMSKGIYKEYSLF